MQNHPELLSGQVFDSSRVCSLSSKAHPPLSDETGVAVNTLLDVVYWRCPLDKRAFALGSKRGVPLGGSRPADLITQRTESESQRIMRWRIKSRTNSQVLPVCALMELTATSDTN